MHLPVAVKEMYWLKWVIYNVIYNTFNFKLQQHISSETLLKLLDK